MHNSKKREVSKINKDLFKSVKTSFEHIKLGIKLLRILKATCSKRRIVWGGLWVL